MTKKVENLVCRYSGVPTCAVDPEGIITAASSDIDEVFPYNKN